MLALTRKFNLLLLLRGSNVCRIRIGIPVSNPLHFKRSSLATNTLPSANGFKVFDSLVLPISGLSIPAFLLHGFRAAMVVETGVGGSGSGGSGDGGGNTGGGTGGSNWSFLPWYLSLLAKYPVMTKAVTSAFLTLVGDLVCQLAIDQVPSLNMKRTSIFTLLGLVLVGPTLHFCKLVTIPGASCAFLRLLLDQFLFAPVFIGVFLSTLVALEGRPSDVIPKLQQEWFSSVLANWQLWIPFQFLNFRFVPLQFQVLAANFVAVVWNVILSYKAHKQVMAK